jgi:hypothetical protein
MRGASDKVSDVRERLATALAEARTAGLAASEQFVKQKQTASDGHLGGTAGWAFVKVRTPSYHFREALKQLNPRATGFQGKWTLLGFGREIGIAASQSLSAHEIACEAARAVLRQYFPEEDLFVDSHMD